MTWPHAVTLKNLTNRHLQAYLVVTTPPPPHREAVPAMDIVGLGERTLDPNSFNPTYYTEGVQSPTKPNGIYIGFDLEFSPRYILYRIFHFIVPPGQEGQDPQLQPKLLNQEAVEISWNADTVMTLDKPDQIVIAPA